MFKNILAKIYELGVNNRNTKYDKKTDIVKLHTPVISIGNLNVGGTSKTPFVQMLTWLLLKNNLKPAIVGLGYKRKSSGSVVISDGKEIFVDVETGGDEMLLLAESLSVPVIAHDNKAEGARLAENKFNPDVIIIDDGFQHRNLYRDLDILMIDNDTLNEPFLMPKGRLREPLQSAERADIVCYVGNVNITPEFSAILKPGTIQIIVNRIAGKVFDLNSGKYLRGVQFNSMRSKTVAFCGIAKPERFDSMLKQDKIYVADSIHFPDHHNYTEKDIRNIIQAAKAAESNYLSTTEKDASKLKKFSHLFDEAGLICCIFPIRLKVTDGYRDFKRILDNTLKNR